MAPRAPIPDDQNIVFLLSCLRNSPGPINFAKVVEDCGIVSVGAATKRFSRLTLKYQNGAAGNDANANGEEGVKMEDAPETNESPSKKTPKKANRGGKGIVRIEKDTIAPITAPRAAGVGKKRSPAKPKANASTTISAFATVAALDGLSLKMGNGAQGGDDEEAGDFVPSFFDEQMDRGVDGE